ncbi:hypothetical protein KCU92_g5560, partial [Aureobasidium melanogenum]|jgi:hypothetical protein
MSTLTNLPPELLSRIVDYTATPLPPDPKRRVSSSYAGQQIPDGSTYAGLSYSNIALATSPAPDIASLRSLRLVSKTFEQLSTPLLFSAVRVLPTEASAERYMKILEEERLNTHVRKVVFQTRKQPNRRGMIYSWDRDKSDDYDHPHSFFLDAMLNVANFKNLTHAELIFMTKCGSENMDNPGPEDIEFRVIVLSTFYAGLADAEKLFNLSIKSLQNITPKALMGKEFAAEEIAFKNNFEVVMRRITQLGLCITVEDWDAAPENTLCQPEVHDFFGLELQEYWLGRVAAQLEYLRIYGNEEAYWGFYPAGNLPHFPALRTLILGDYSFTSEKQVQWILSHADTLEELVLDDAMIGVAVSIAETHVDIPSRTIVYGKDHSSEPPGYQPKWRGRTLKSQVWKDPTRWHHLFKRFAEGLPKLRHFAVNHSHWDSKAYEHADALCSAVRIERYGAFSEGVWDDFASYDAEDFDWTDWREDGNEIIKFQVEEPGCEEEDWQALNEFLAELKGRR